tara:strand:- start:4498 stop:5049 length:552 start_codon:yes stop_codon:yes gene_type:complete
MIKVGITGSIASGKSTVAKILSSKKYPIFDADHEVKKIYKKKSFKKKIYKILGVRNKKDIKRIISKNPKKLKTAEKIIHPHVRKKLRTFIKKNKRKKLLIFEIPLLVESRLMSKFDKIVFVNSKKNLRLRRFLKRKKDIKLFNILNKRQLKPAKKIKFSDYVINNNNTLAKLMNSVKILQGKL